MSGTYICDTPSCIALGNPSAHTQGHCWHESVWRRLAWLYGESRAQTIMLRQDKRTEKDIAAWERLGS